MANKELSGLLLALLNYFRANAGRTVSRAELCETVWKLKLYPQSRVVDQAVATLRKNLTPGQSIETVHGLGYRYEKGPP